MLLSWMMNDSVRRLFAVSATRQLRELYIFSLLFSFAFALITIFEPVFFYQQGFSLEKIVLYYAVHYSLYIVVMPLGGKFAARFGLERSIAVSLPLFVLYFIALTLVPQDARLIWVAAVLLTLHKTFYWPAFHADFAQFSDGGNRGTELSWMTFIVYGTGIAGPLFGGIIATWFGFPTLFIVAACTVILSGLPMLRTRERYDVSHFPYASPWRLLRSRQHRRMALAMVGMGEELVHLVLWPIFLYAVLGDPETLGLVTAFAVALMAVWSFFVGELIDHSTPRRVLRGSALWLTVANIARLAAVTPLRALVINSGVHIATVRMRTPLLSRLYAEARRFGSLRYSLAFEMALAVSKAATAWILFFVFLSVTSGTGFAVAFGLAAFLSFFYVLL